MRYWVRELAGWVLVLLGLFVFYVCFAVLLGDGSLLFESIFFTVIGVVVFRSGMHLLKVAVAARVCLHAQARLQQEEAKPKGRAVDRPRLRTRAGDRERIREAPSA
ncbi:MAG: hypothetical protein L0Z62_43085 [Gemmataceae bacterium]|nr:hypothetical protein [Gemmataceae bacterium]